MSRKLSTLFVTSILAGASLSVAGPITTVAWNGYTGAASFGFDDGRGSQLTNLMPQLDKMGIKATFFLANNMYTFPGQKADWIAVAKKGHEIANHSGNHNSPTPANVADMAKILRAMDPSIEAVTYAYPNCTVTSDGDAEAFLSRGCQFGSSAQTRYAWGTEPNWKDILALNIQPNMASTVTAFLDGAKSGNTWAVIFSHDVIASPDQYSETPSDNQTILDRAVADKLWIGTYQEVGAYYRAHFTMDKVTASGSGPWDLTWTSPNPKMPKKVLLKVKLATATFGTTFTVSQDNVAIPANADGSYTIDFMKLKMSVKAGGTSVTKYSIPGNARVSTTASSLVLEGLVAGDYTLSLRTIEGTLLQRTNLSAISSEELRVALPSSAHGRPLLAVLDAPGRQGTFRVMAP